jgi:hypothetical protein
MRRFTKEQVQEAAKLITTGPGPDGTHIQRRYKVTVRQVETTFIATTIEAADEDEARGLAQARIDADDMAAWDYDTSETTAEIEDVEEVDEPS